MHHRTMNRAIPIFVCLLVASGCVSGGESSADASRGDAGGDDVATLDAGDDADGGVACDAPDELACLARIDCIWEGGACTSSPRQRGERALNFSLQGLFTVVATNGSEPLFTARNMEFGTVARGVVRWSDDTTAGVLAAEDPGDAIEVELFRGGVATHTLRGWVDPQRIVFDEIVAHQEGDDALRDGVVMIPNDGWKPTSDGSRMLMPGRREGTVYSVDGDRTCALEVSEPQPGTFSVTSLQCDGSDIALVDGEQSFDLDEARFWFAANVDGERQVWVVHARDLEFNGIVARDEGLWNDGPPPLVSEVPAAQVIGHFRLF